MENPKAPAGASVESANVTFVVAHALRSHAFAKGRANNHRVLGHDGSGLDADFAGRQIRENLLIVIQLEIQFAAVAEGRNANAVLGVQADEAIARGHIEDSLFFTVGPVRQSSP